MLHFWTDGCRFSTEDLWVFEVSI